MHTRVSRRATEVLWTTVVFVVAFAIVFALNPGTRGVQSASAAVDQCGSNDGGRGWHDGRYFDGPPATYKVRGARANVNIYWPDLCTSQQHRETIHRVIIFGKGTADGWAEIGYGKWIDNSGVSKQYIVYYAKTSQSSGNGIF